MSNFEIRNLTKSKVDTKFLKEVAGRAIKFLKIKNLESLVIVGDARMRSLNKKYRQKDKTTDVLTFDYGEIFICLPQAKRQAKKSKHSLKEELATLLIHGILHLAGYNDEETEDRENMMKMQEKIVKKIV
jgi:probable rRNA maturation factor